MGERTNDVDCVVVENVKRSTLRWFGNVEKWEIETHKERVRMSLKDMV